MRAIEDLPGTIETTMTWIEPVLWLGVGAGVLMIATGCVGAALARWRSENTYVARNAEFLLLWGTVLGIACGVLSAVFFVALGGSGGGVSAGPKTVESGLSRNRYDDALTIPPQVDAALKDGRRQALVPGNL
ncbi:hypothetical protein ACFQ77_22060 [Streptomyces virginiae]|uniref:hypothetical protein n=1 Tax=Streptomyces virginiae TaxID=1961 RepID=UPI00368D30BD